MPLNPPVVSGGSDYERVAMGGQAVAPALEPYAGAFTFFHDGTDTAIKRFSDVAAARPHTGGEPR